MFNLQKERLIKAEEERTRLDKENIDLKTIKDKLSLDQAQMKDQVKMLADFHKRDEELITSKTNEAKLFSEESRVFKQMFEELRVQNTKDKEGMN